MDVKCRITSFTIVDVCRTVILFLIIKLLIMALVAVPQLWHIYRDVAHNA